MEADEERMKKKFCFGKKIAGGTDANGNKQCSIPLTADAKKPEVAENSFTPVCIPVQVAAPPSNKKVERPKQTVVKTKRTLHGVHQKVATTSSDSGSSSIRPFSGKQKRKPISSDSVATSTRPAKRLKPIEQKWVDLLI